MRGPIRQCAGLAFSRRDHPAQGRGHRQRNCYDCCPSRGPAQVPDGVREHPGTVQRQERSDEMRKVVIRAGDSNLLEHLSGLRRISPGHHGGAEGAAIQRRNIWAADPGEPLFASGGETIYEVARGFCLEVVDGVPGQDWRITGIAGAEHSIRLRIIFEGEMYVASTDHPTAKSTNCAFAVQPAGEMLSVRVRGGSVIRSCVMSVSEAFLRGIVGAGNAELPAALATAWQRGERSIGAFPVSRQTLLKARQCLMPPPDGPWADVRLRAIAHELLYLIFSDWMKLQHDGARIVRITREDHAKLVAIRDHVSRNFHVGVTAHQLSREYAINRNKLHYGFKHLFGESLHDYCVDKRMRAAANLLLTTDLAVSEIAWKAGFSEPTNFAAAFKRYFGSAPSQVRHRAASLVGREQ